MPITRFTAWFTAGAMALTIATVPVATSSAASRYAAPAAVSAYTPDLFRYDAAAPLHFTVLSETHDNGIAVQDVTFAGPHGEAVKAYLVLPNGGGPFAGAIFFHWFAPGTPHADRTEFLGDAVTLAKEGTASLLLAGVFPWKGDPNGVAHDRARVVQEVDELRRGVDLLVSRPDVDPKRLAFVGHDFGAMYGAVLAGVDHRLKAYVLMAATARFSDWFLPYWQFVTSGDQQEAYTQAMSDVDPLTYIGHAAPAALFFQFAINDQYISQANALSLYVAASAPKRRQWYASDHGLNAAARHDRLTWLRTQLGLHAAAQASQ